MFYLVEEFFSIQGEGKYAGTPSYFLRTGGCNLSCGGFGTPYSINGSIKYGCDTYFAVDRSFSNSWQKIESADIFISHLKTKFDTIGYLPHVVITGGEPLLYVADEVFYAVFSWLIDIGTNVTFETNGVIEINFDKFPLYRKAIFALSIKLSNSGEPASKRINIDAIKKIINNSQESFFKFTLNKEIIGSSALNEISDLVSILPAKKIYCMPVGESRSALEKNDKTVFAFCMKHGFNYSDRLHIRIFDTTQGV
ncbi:MAG: 7-carboxy-7-deazaguanine synthase QueE [Sulfurovaceae bacterium]|nr:7-carboxy-7-deazaguanine synthase QueE [Sulfurovaceae bacterium]